MEWKETGIAVKLWGLWIIKIKGVFPSGIVHEFEKNCDLRDSSRIRQWDWMDSHGWDIYSWMKSSDIEMEKNVTFF